MSIHANPEDIVDNLRAMGYSANHYTREADGDKRPINAVYINAGTSRVKAYLDLMGETPAFKVWTEYEEGYKPRHGEPLHGAELVRYNVHERERVRADLTPAALAAYAVAADGGDLQALQSAFGLAPCHDRYKAKGPKEEVAAEAQGPAAAPAAAPGM
ncbi:hypothetical protein [Arvimicrobium flavum]|uniref:hypothetical protein n=1 Tax=Arvimicrobium flavum TaxID=3393320 RepID=UPI00237BA269|nr:hypothetical protein [Mesorhizobium shangrilense]